MLASHAEPYNTLHDLLADYTVRIHASAEPSPANATRCKKASDLEKNTRASFRRFAELLQISLDEVNPSDFASQFSLHSRKVTSCMRSRGSASAHISRVRKALAWAGSIGRLLVPEVDINNAGYKLFRRLPISQKAPSVSGSSVTDVDIDDANRFIAFLVVSGVHNGSVKPNHLDAFRATSNISLSSRAVSLIQQTISAELSNVVDDAQVDKVVPHGAELGASCIKRHYSMALSELPCSLRLEVGQALILLTSASIRARHGCRPLSRSSANLCRHYLLALIGFCLKRRLVSMERDEDACLALIVTADNVLMFIDHLNDRSLKRLESKVPLGHRADRKYGYSERTCVWQMVLIARRVLGDQELTGRLRKLHRNIRSRVESRREAYKDIGKLDDLFHVARTLLELSDAPSRQGIGRLQRALLRRDALLFCLVGCFCYRRAILSGFKLQSVSIEDDKLPVLATDRRRTKTRRSNHWHEVPIEIRFLFHHYTEVERPILCGGKPSEALFIGRGGEPLTPAAVSDVFKERSRQVLGVERNVHLARKCWITEFLAWSEGDYMTASVIADNTRLTMEMHYRKHSYALRVHSRFDAARRTAALSAKAEIVRDELK